MSARWSKRNCEPKWLIRSGYSSASKKALRVAASSSVRALRRCWSVGLCSLRWVSTARAATIDTGCWM
ncbi:hypothetical protein FHS36_005457 [Streptomyces eurocidicus]|uniref:Uncharacterized protein n=1 Tax=Streptomyces eurocidicus TaxID=66423 RepID=A0A7W8BEM6_STREU|nr:hypothetical protein [Streptomyces eurocidicus]